MTVTTLNEGGKPREPETASTWMQGPNALVTVVVPTTIPVSSRQMKGGGGVPLPLDLVASIELLRRSLLHSDTAPRYSPVDRLGSGTQGVVWRVSDRDCRRELAFKLLAADSATSEDVGRFVMEAQITAQLEHPGIPPVHDIGRLSDGTLYYSMKCVEGVHLADHMATRSGRPEHRFALLQIYLSICQTIAFAHSKGVIHRDLKPKNVMVGRYGEVLIMDWGLAKIIGSSEDSSAVRSDRLPLADDAYQTMHGTAVGTPAYMSPEQASGDVAGLDTRCDVYSLGVLLYELLAGTSPYERGDVQRVMRQCREGTWARLDRRPEGQVLPRPLVAIVHRAMALVRDQRYQSVEALADDLRAYLVGQPVAAHRDGVRTALHRAIQQRRGGLRAVALIAGAALLVGGGAWLANLLHDRGVAAGLRAQAEHEAAEGRLEAAEGTVQRLLVLHPDDRWAGIEQVRLQAERRRLHGEEQARQEAQRQEAQRRRQGLELAAHARAAAAAGDEAGLRQAGEDYLAAIALGGDDPGLREASQAVAQRLADLRSQAADAARRASDLAAADVRLAEARAALALAERSAGQAEARRSESARLRLLADAAPDAGIAGRIADLDESAAAADRAAATQDALGVEALEQALALAPAHAEALRALADWSVRALRQAEARDDASQAAVLAMRARRSDVEGRHRDLLAGLGRISVPADAPAIALQALAEDGDHVLRPEGPVRSVAPGTAAALAAGPWLARGPDGAARAVLLVRGEGRDLRLDPPPPVPDDAVALPAGGVRDRHGRLLAAVPAFALARREVSCGEYLLFLNDPATQAEMGAAAAAGRVVRLPRSAADGRTSLWSRGPDGFVLRAADGSPIPPARPVGGISLADAQAYARWRAGREGRAWRLPTRLEWCAAVQGGDSRAFPWGRRFAASLVLAGCVGEDGRPRLPPGGSHPADATPEGLLDLAGSLAELAAPLPGAAVTWACGGSFRDQRPERFADDSARPMAVDAVDDAVGFRLALTLP